MMPVFKLLAGPGLCHRVVKRIAQTVTGQKQAAAFEGVALGVIFGAKDVGQRLDEHQKSPFSAPSLAFCRTKRKRPALGRTERLKFSGSRLFEKPQPRSSTIATRCGILLIIPRTEGVSSSSRVLCILLRPSP